MNQHLLHRVVELDGVVSQLEGYVAMHEVHRAAAIASGGAGCPEGWRASAKPNLPRGSVRGAYGEPEHQSYRWGLARAVRDVGFNDSASLDDGPMWPTAFALKELTAAAEAKALPS